MTKSLNIRGDYEEAFRTSAVKSWPLGTRMHLADNRVFRYSLAGSTALTVARVMQAAQQDTAVVDASITPNKIDLRSRQVTLDIITAKRVTQDTYEGGLLYVNSGTGVGHVYHVQGNDLLEPGSTKAQLTVYLGSDFQVALGASSRVTLLRNRHHSLVVAPAPPNSAVVGVTPVAVAANSYFWLQTGGPCAVLQNDDLEPYLPVAASLMTSGAVEAATVMVPNIAGELHGVRGLVMQPVLSDDAGPLKWRLASSSGVGVVPTLSMGYVLDPRESGQHCLIHLTLEGG